MEPIFSLTRNSDIILYGAAAVGTIMYKNLKDTGFKICAYIDKRANEIDELFDTLVYGTSQLQQLLEKYPEAVVIISVKNVFEHSNIASMLVENGFKRIIYRPYSVLLGEFDTDLSCLNQAYDSIENQTFNSITDLPVSTSVINYKFKDYSIVYKDGSNITALVPIELVYSYNTRDLWGNLPMVAFFPHIQFFCFLAGDTRANIYDYVRFCEFAAQSQDIKITNAWRKNVIRNRTQLFEQMSTSLEIDPDFFIRSAPKAVWNSNRNYFNLTSGKHRVSFLVAKKRLYIPLCMLETDYEEWINQDSSLEFQNVIIENRVTEISCYVAHPNFFRFQVYGEYCLRLFWVAILQDMFCKIVQQEGIPVIEGKNILCWGEFSDYFALYLKKAGANIFRETENDTNKEVDAIRKLMGEQPDDKTYNSNVSLDFAVLYWDCNKVFLPAKQCYLITRQLIEFDEMENFNQRIKLLCNSNIESIPHYLYVYLE